MDKHTLIIGATNHPARYSYLAAQRLKARNIPFSCLGLQPVEVFGVQIHTPPWMPEEAVHTVTLYINPKRQDAYFDYLIRLRPARVIFNPGTENTSLMRVLEQEGIEAVEACTLVMLATGAY